MKPFKITTPQLKLRQCPHGEESYFLSKREMLCSEILASFFVIGECKKISLLLASEPGEESVAIVIFKSCGGSFFYWRKRGQRRAVWNSIFDGADVWLLSKPPFRNMAANSEIIVHVTVFLHPA